jgi:hypothetical protein
LSSNEARFRLFDRIVTFLRNAAAETPCVLVLDDLHWGDSASLRVLEFLAHGIGAIPVLVIGTYRERSVPCGRCIECTRRRDSGQSRVRAFTRSRRPERIRGRAPDRLRFELGVRPDRPPLAVYLSGDRVA